EVVKGEFPRHGRRFFDNQRVQHLVGLAVGTGVQGQWPWRSGECQGRGVARCGCARMAKYQFEDTHGIYRCVHCSRRRRRRRRQRASFAPCEQE
ncbi:unnamed protein product, partial [Ectocarpus sp. 12 AP-2014]